MLIITDFINKRFLPLDFSETVADVSLFLKQNYFSHFPVEVAFWMAVNFLVFIASLLVTTSHYIA